MNNMNYVRMLHEQNKRSRRRKYPRLIDLLACTLIAERSNQPT